MVLAIISHLLRERFAVLDPSQSPKRLSTPLSLTVNTRHDSEPREAGKRFFRELLGKTAFRYCPTVATSAVVFLAPARL